MNQQNSPNTLWVKSPLWDTLWMFSGFWLTLTIFASSYFVPIAVFTGVLFLSNRLVALAHSWTTTYLALLSPLFKDLRKNDRKTYFYWPLAIISSSFLFGYLISQYQWFGEIGEMTGDLWIWCIYILIFWVGHFWHFGCQDFGVLSFYRSRAGQKSETERKRDLIYVRTMMFLIQPIIFLSVTEWRENPFREIIHTFVPFNDQIIHYLSTPSLILAVAISAYMIIMEFKNQLRSLPKILYYLIMVSHPVLLFYTSPLTGPLFVVTYLASHWMIAIGLGAYINTNHYVREKKYKASTAWIKHSVIIAFIIVPVWYLSKGFTKYNVFSTNGLDIRVMLAEISAETHILAGFFFGYFLAEQLIHFYADRVLFRFRDPDTRKRITPLITE